MLMVVIGRSLLIFSDVTFKIAAWWPYWIFCVGAYWFSAMLISKWLPGSHIGYFGFWTLTLIWLWITTPNLSGILLQYMGRSLLIFSIHNHVLHWLSLAVIRGKFDRLICYCNISWWDSNYLITGLKMSYMSICYLIWDAIFSVFS